MPVFSRQSPCTSRSQLVALTGRIVLTRRAGEPKTYGLRSSLLRLAIAALLASCHAGDGDAAPSCGAAAAKFVEIAKYDLANAKADDATTRAITDQLPAMRDALVQLCSEGKWSPSTRNCLVRASDHIGFAACEQQLTDEQRRDLDRATRGTHENP